jgi:hypothetical protein
MHVGLANKGGLDPLIFERQVVDLLHVGLLDGGANELWSSYQRFPLIGAWHTGYLERNRYDRVHPYLQPVRFHEDVVRSFDFLSVPWHMSKYRFPLIL